MKSAHPLVVFCAGQVTPYPIMCQLPVASCVLLSSSSAWVYLLFSINTYLLAQLILVWGGVCTVELAYFISTLSGQEDLPILLSILMLIILEVLEGAYRSALTFVKSYLLRELSSRQFPGSHMTTYSPRTYTQTVSWVLTLRNPWPTLPVTFANTFQPSVIGYDEIRTAFFQL
jgi:hypothetical protein